MINAIFGKIAGYGTNRIFLLSVLFMFLCAMPVWSRGNPDIHTRWERSHGLQVGEDIYFLSYYYLYKPGKTIIPMFMVTPSRRLYSDMSLYRLSSGPQDKLERLWTYDIHINVKNCWFARSEDKIYISWTSRKKEDNSPLPALEYDLSEHTGRRVELPREEGELSTSIDLHFPDPVNRLELWGRAGLLPLSEWELPSPLEYSSKNPRFLKKVIVEQMVDREFRAAALSELDDQGNAKILKQILAETEKERGKASFDTLKWEVLIRMSKTLRSDRPDNMFSAAFDNDTVALTRFLDSGEDPDSADERGRTLMMWAVLGGAPDTMELLFERGADPKKKSDCGLFPWWYAALSPLRAQFLELQNQ